MFIQMDVEAIYLRGFEHRCSGDYQSAKNEFHKVLAAEPLHWRARHQMGLIQGFEGDFDGSLATLSALSTEYPNNLEVLYDLAMTQMMLGESDLACANFRKILASDPDHDRAQQQIIYCP